MEVWKAAILGAVQGLTEFLPVSSSGHLVFLQRVLGIEGDMLFFDTMLHVGTLVAVFIVMWQEIWGLLRKPVQKLMGYLILATVPLVIATLFFGDFFEEAFGGALLGFGFLLTSAVLIGMNFLKPGTRTIHDMGWKRALTTGAVQIIAVFPGVSRSGSTMLGARAVGVANEDSARFSFLMSIPAILGSLVWQMKDIVTDGVGDVAWISTIVGMIIAAVTGYFAMKLLLDIVKRGKLWYFGIYTAALGAFVLLDQFVLHIWF